MSRNVLLLVDALHMVNGVTVSARELAEHWDDPTWKLHVYGTGHGSPEYVVKDSATLRKVTHPLRIPLGYYDEFDLAFPVLRTWWYFRKSRPAIIHSMVPGPLGWRGMWYAWRCRIPYIVTHFTRFHVYSRMYAGRGMQAFVNNVMRRTYSRADLVIAHSPASAQEAYDFGATKVVYVPIGIPVPFKIPEQLHTERRQARQQVTERFGLDPGQPILLYVGRFSIEKNLHTVLAAAQALPYPFIFAGGGPLQDEVDRHPQAVCTGMLHGRDLVDLYLATDLLISASVTETVGRVFLEALAYGTPILVPDRGQHASLFPQSCPAISKFRWAEADGGLQNLVREAEISLTVNDRDGLASAALEFVRDFAWENVIPQHVALYDNVIENRLSGQANAAQKSPSWQTPLN